MAEIKSRRWLYLFVVLLSTGLGVSQLWQVLRIDGLTLHELTLLILFAILFAWINMAFWLACFGMLARLEGAQLLPLAPPRESSTSRTAIIMPVYNENVGSAFSRIAAIREALAQNPGFDFYILSDSTNPDYWIAEELEWQRLRQTGAANIFYRHRPRNIGRKSGNIQDFCENWGSLYDYMVILDADSLMCAETLEKLVGLMDANPRTALIQTQARLVGRGALFARLLQFSSSVYGPVFAAGLAALQGPDGNYYGHNAIIRVRAFIAHCGLPRLPGRPPFGGEIMSHDFIEAALLRRAGWNVWMAPELDGSYEEPPPTAYDFLKRDRRWCQGNLQHLRVIFAQGLKLPSRLHLAMGIMSYVSAPLWLLLVAAAATLPVPADTPVTYVGLQPALALSVSHNGQLLALALATLALLYAPKAMAAAALLCDPVAVRAHGGAARLLAGVLAESLFSTLFAPIVMLQHSWYVVMIVMGIPTGWGAQQRHDRALPMGFVIRQYGLHTLAGLGAAWLLWRAMPQSFAWFVPLLAGLVLAIPLVRLTSSLELGTRLKRAGLFLTPVESAPPAILAQAHHLMASRPPEPQDARRLVLEDAWVRRLHLALLADVPLPAQDPARMARLVQAAQGARTADFSREDWAALLCDADSLKALAAS